MQHNTKILVISGMSAASLLAAVAVFAADGKPTTVPLNVAPAGQMHAGPAVIEEGNDESPAVKQARQVDRRLRNQDKPSPGITAIARAIEEREALMDRTVTLTIEPDAASGKAPVTTSLTLKQFPSWLTLTTTRWSAHAAVNADAVQASLEKGEIPGVGLMRPAEVTSVALDNKNVLRATATAVAKPGFIVDAKNVAVQIAQAFEQDLSEVVVSATYGEPTVTVTKDGVAKTYTLLGTGMSDFADSTSGREWNVHKAIDERINNVVVPAGETFSLIAALDAPITLEKGWKEALGLFGGGAAMTPGGGICQSATTLYRAALLAGMPIVEKRAHSLFVNHYEFYGVGLDATVFPGFHDVRFRNDTGDDMVIQAYTEGITVYVRLYGKDDGRTAVMDGPYFAATKNRNPALRPLGYNQIGWVRTITRADGTQVHEPVVASYAKPLWGYLKKYTGAGMQLLTTREI